MRRVGRQPAVKVPERPKAPKKKSRGEIQKELEAEALEKFPDIEYPAPFAHLKSRQCTVFNESGERCKNTVVLGDVVCKLHKKKIIEDFIRTGESKHMEDTVARETGTTITREELYPSPTGLEQLLGSLVTGSPYSKSDEEKEAIQKNISVQELHRKRFAAVTGAEKVLSKKEILRRRRQSLKRLRERGSSGSSTEYLKSDKPKKKTKLKKK